MKEVYQKTKEELFNEYGHSKGLNDEKASEYLEKYGENILISKKKKSVARVFLEQFADLLVIILIIAAVVSMMTGNSESTITAASGAWIILSSSRIADRFGK